MENEPNPTTETDPAKSLTPQQPEPLRSGDAEADLLDVAADLANRQAAERRQREAGPKPLDFAARLAKVPQRPQLTPEQQREREAAQARSNALEAEREAGQRRAALVSQIGKRYAHATLATFRADTPEQRAALVDVSEYADRIVENVRDGVGLLLSGPPGTGKDHLAAGVMFAAVDKKLRVRWINGVDLFASARDGITAEANEKQWADQFIAPDLLTISDPVPPAGQIRDGWQISKLFQIIDGRYRAMRPTILTLNILDRAEAAARMSENIVDRLAHGAIVVTCNWPSYRRPRA